LKTYLEPREITLIEEAAANLRDHILVRILFRLGCRISEALAITVDDIDIRGRTVKIQHLKTRLLFNCPHCSNRLGRSHSYCPKCGKRVKEAMKAVAEQRRQRILPIDESTTGLLQKYIQRGGSVAKDGKLLVFPINRHRAWQIVKECAERAGLPKLVNPETGKVHNVSPHRFRDAFAVHAVMTDDSGDGLRLLQEHLGHQSISTTMKYRKIAGEEHREWYQKLWSKESPANGTTA